MFFEKEIRKNQNQKMVYEERMKRNADKNKKVVLRDFES
jgi:hypothetical protein